MENWMDEAEDGLPPLRSFILPGGGSGASELHICRTVCRRAERAVLALAGDASAEREPGDVVREPGVALAIRYLNRLSDLLFVLARLENARSGRGM
jgi:cob(I)alamin adenosyltransferase